VFADNVLPACLVAAGLIKVSPAIKESIDRLVDMGQPPDVLSQIDSRLRAVAVTVCDQIVARAKEVKEVGEGPIGKMNACELDSYLWSLGKEEGYRGLTRSVNKQTPYY